MNNFNYNEYVAPTYKVNQKNYSLNIVLGNGGAGDMIGTLPAIKWAYDNHPHIDIKLWMHDYGVALAENCLPKSPRLEINSFAHKETYNKDNVARATHIHHYTNLAAHITSQAFEVLMNTQVPPECMNYPQLNLDDIGLHKFGLPKKYVVVTTGFTAPVREMHPQVINELSAYIKDKGYMPIYLGKTETETGVQHKIKGTFNKLIDYSLGIDLRDKTTLLESAKIISCAKTIVGLDNGLIHLAAASNVELPIVCSFTTVHPRHRAPYRKDILGYKFYPIIPDEECCRFCQSNFNFTHGFDMKYCYNASMFKDHPEWAYECVLNLTSDKYIKVLETIL